MGLWLFTNVKEFLFFNELLKHLFHLLFFHYVVYDSYISKCKLKVQRNHKLHPQK